MKYTEKMFFAQPVLRHGSDDFTSGSLTVDIGAASVSKDSVEFIAKMDLSCPSLEKLIKDGGATAAIFITCLDTRFSQSSQIPLAVGKNFTLPAAKLFGRVTILPVVYSSRLTGGWSSENLHPEYTGSVDILPASLLAVGEESTFSVDRKRLKPLESIFELAADDTQEEGLIKVDTDGQKITLLVHPETKEDLDGIRNSSAGQAILLSSVYLPALMEVFSQIQQNDNSCEKNSWFRVFGAKCDGHGIDPMNCSPLDASQTLLGIPFLKLNSIATELL